MEVIDPKRQIDPKQPRRDLRAARPPGKHDHLFGATFALAGVCAALFAAGVFGYQCILWLKDGFWTPFEFRAVLMGAEVASPGWAGVQKILDGLWTAPLSLSVFAIGFFVIWLGGFASEAARARYAAYVRERERATKKS